MAVYPTTDRSQDALAVVRRHSLSQEVLDVVSAFNPLVIHLREAARQLRTARRRAEHQQIPVVHWNTAEAVFHLYVALVSKTFLYEASSVGRCEVRSGKRWPRAMPLEICSIECIFGFWIAPVSVQILLNSCI